MIATLEIVSVSSYNVKTIEGTENFVDNIFRGIGTATSRSLTSSEQGPRLVATAGSRQRRKMIRMNNLIDEEERTLSVQRWPFA